MNGAAQFGRMPARGLKRSQYGRRDSDLTVEVVGAWGESGVNFTEQYKGYTLEFVREGTMVIILEPSKKVLDVFDTNRSGVQDELRALARARIDEELGGASSVL